jgi:hypothetical protein
MRSSRVIALAGAAVAFGCAALLYQTGEDAPARESSAVPAARGTTTSETGLARVRGEVAALRAQVAGLDKHASATAPSGEEADPPRKLTRQELLAADEELHAAYIAKVEDTYERDPADPAWSVGTTSRVWETIRQMDFLRDAARSVDCRSHTCRIEVDDDGTGVLHKNLPVFGQQFADVLPVLAGRPVRGGDGHRRMILYLLEMDQRPPVEKIN